MPQSGTYGSVGALGGNPRATRQPAMPRTEPQERRVAESPDHADHGKSSRLINLMIRHASVLKTLCVTSYGSQKVARSSKREPQRRPSGQYGLPILTKRSPESLSANWGIANLGIR